MDRSPHTYSSLDELRHIQHEVRRTASLEDLRLYFDRIQFLRRTNPEDFDLQLLIAEVQDEVIDRARGLRGQPASTLLGQEPPPSDSPRLRRETKPKREPESAEYPPEAERIDAKTWQRATYLALFFTVILFAAFFYLIQTARRLNQTPAEIAGQATQPNHAVNPPKAENAANTAPAAPTQPTLRLYTDLVPGTVVIDGNQPQELKDGELILDKLDPGRHSIQVTGRNASAAFSYDVDEKAAPRVVGLPTVSNVMAVLVSTQGGKAQLVTNAEQSAVLLDGKPAGQVGTDGLTLENLGTTDHELQVSEGKDRQRFVLTYTSAPALTVYIKSDPNAGTVVIMAGQNGADVYINNNLYRRKTIEGQLRIPNLRVGTYIIRVHKAGFIDPPPVTVSVKKAEESAVQFHLEPVPQIATLQIKGALPGTMVYVDNELAAAIGPDGNASISNIRPGNHAIELRRDQALTKKFERTFRTGDVVSLSGPDVTLEKVVVENKPTPTQETAPSNEQTPAIAMQIPGEHIRKGGGFVPYHVPKVAGQYTFAAEARKSGFLRHSKVQWYAAYADAGNYILFTLDGKHATIRKVSNGKSDDLRKVPFSMDSDEWVQVNLSVRPHALDARIRTPDGVWTDLGSVPSSGGDFTQGKVGFYIPGNDELAVSNFRFYPR